MGKAGPPLLYFPSWVPRWDLADSTRRMSAFTLGWIPDFTRNLTEKLNKASKETLVTMDHDAPLSTLRVLGVRVDTAKVCLPPVIAAHASVPEHYGSELSKGIPKLYRECEKLVHHKQVAFDKTFFLVTTAGLTPEHGDARLEPPSAYESVANLTYDWAEAQTAPGHVLSTKKSSMLPNADDGPQRQLDEPSNMEADGHGWDTYPYRYIASLQRLMNRRLFITSSGNLGLGPANMMRGDTVAILFGGNVPYILRPLEKHQWHFVGECYLDGYMNGEALDNEGKDAQSHEWFEMV